ncbi:MAG: nucleotide exchange factor GrpE [Pacificimonas sp.]|jgi:molecular chaperone GrpE|nr:nucleotide exchange factor GrpE [Pacificimonas sp.]
MTDHSRPDEDEQPDFSNAEAELAEAEAEEAAGLARKAEGEDETAEGYAEAADEQRLTELESENAALKDRLARALAETENVRRRLEREKTDSSAYAITGFARDLLSVSDNLTRALDAAAQDEVVNKGLLEGVQATHRELMRIFEKNGITKVEAVGAGLDPNLHQAMMEVEASDEHPAGTVVQELQPGYTIKDRLLRPAMVSVAK